jgi:hypothetical protein
MAKLLDENGVLYIWNKIKTLLSGKVDAESGKGLSTNDYTTEEKTKLAGIDEGANNYTLPTATTTAIGGVMIGGDIVIDSSTGKLALRSDLTLPEGTEVESSPPSGNNTTAVATTAFVQSTVKTAVNNAVSGITSFEFKTVTSLPSSGSKGVIYLLSNGGSSPNQYDEYIWTGSAFEKIGTTAVDLSGYWAKTDLTALTNAEIDSICV